MTKSINNMATLKALIADEAMASKEYYALAQGLDVPEYMQRILISMSKDELRHHAYLVKYLEAQRR
jgi:hypothetical protein